MRVGELICLLMIRRPPRSTLDRSSAASDVYKRQITTTAGAAGGNITVAAHNACGTSMAQTKALTVSASVTPAVSIAANPGNTICTGTSVTSVSYTHLRAHETVLDLVCRLLLEKKKYA